MFLAGAGVFGEQGTGEIAISQGILSLDAETAGQPPLDPGGERIGPYEIIEELGRGGMGRVYAARQEGLGRIVALKVIVEGGENAIDRELRFLREAETMARLRHPHIVPVYDSGRVPGRLYFSMDLIDGGDLARRLRQRVYTPREAAGLLGKVAGALAYAHGEGVLHRDIKPSNILLEGEEPRLADFGLAVPLEAQGELTATGQFFGTPHYMAPEVLREGSKAFSVASDIYAVGVVLFLMLTGRTPFAGVTSVAELASIMASHEPPPPRLLAPAVPSDLGTVCLKCLERDPAKRYASAADLTADLRRFCEGEPIVARPVSAPVRVLRWSRRRPALAILVVALASGVIGTAWAALAINAGRQRAMRAEGEAREELWRANLAHGQAARRTTAASARREALGAIADAARFRPSLALRDEAIAALCLDDVQLLRSWPLELEWTAVIAFDPALESYVAEISPGRLVRRACANDRELGRLEVSGTKVLGIPVFSPDGRYLAARYADNTVRVWQIDAGRVAFALPGRPSPMAANTVNYGFDLAFRPDGRQLAVGAGGGWSHPARRPRRRGRGALASGRAADDLALLAGWQPARGRRPVGRAGAVPRCPDVGGAAHGCPARRADLRGLESGGRTARRGHPGLAHPFHRRGHRRDRGHHHGVRERRGRPDRVPPATADPRRQRVRRGQYGSGMRRADDYSCN